MPSSVWPTPMAPRPTSPAICGSCRGSDLACSCSHSATAAPELAGQELLGLGREVVEQRRAGLRPGCGPARRRAGPWRRPCRPCARMTPRKTSHVPIPRRRPRRASHCTAGSIAKLRNRLITRIDSSPWRRPPSAVATCASSSPPATPSAIAAMRRPTLGQSTTLAGGRGRGRRRGAPELRRRVTGRSRPRRQRPRSHLGTRRSRNLPRLGGRRGHRGRRGRRRLTSGSGGRASTVLLSRRWRAAAYGRGAPCGSSTTRP